MNARILLCTCGLMLLFGSCREEFDDHYNEVNDASIGKSVVQVLEEREGFELFVNMIRRADLERTLSQSGLYTCFAPRDEHVQAWLDEKGWTVESIPERVLIDFINYHFMLGMVYYYDFEKYYENSGDWDKSPFAYAGGIKQDTRTSGKAHPSKAIRVFTNSYLTVRADDYRKMMDVTPGDFMVENIPVSVTDRDIPTSNGVIHVLDGPLLLTPRMDEVIASDPDLSIINKWFSRFSGYATVGMENDRIDTTLMKYYDVALKPGSKALNIADENFVSTAFLPTDDAMERFFSPYLTPELLVSFDSVPNELVVPFLRSLVAQSSQNIWGLSDITRNSPIFSSYSGAMLPLRNNLAGMYTGALISSNSTIYKINEVPDIPLFANIEVGYLINYKRYREWTKLVDRKSVNIDSWFGMDNSFQHSPRTVLIQADDSRAWDNGPGSESGIDGYEEEYLDTLVMRLQTGVLQVKLDNGKFEHRYYPTAYGSVLCEYDGDGQPVFTDFKGGKVHLTAPNPVWEADNGAIFEVDGIFNHLHIEDSTELLYRKYIAKDADLSLFRELVEKAEKVDMLDRIDRIKYTVFAPCNEALRNRNISTMTKEDAEKLFNKCVVSGRCLFTDGVSEGVITMLDGSTRNLSGAWENCSIRATYDRAGFVQGKCNIQGSNGVLHIVDGLVEN